MSAVLQPACASDAPAVSRILSDWIGETEWMPSVHPIAEQQTFGRLLIDRMTVNVVRDAGETVGFLARKRAWIHSLYLRKDARGRGLGSMLLDQAKTGQQTLNLWTFQANEAARHFYRRHGFVEDQFTDGSGNDENLPDVRMTWKRGLI